MSDLNREAINYCLHEQPCACDQFYENCIKSEEDSDYQELVNLDEFKELERVLASSNDERLLPLKKFIKLLHRLGNISEVSSSPTFKAPLLEFEAAIQAFCAMIASASTLPELFDAYLYEPLSLDYVLEHAMSALDCGTIDSCDPAVRSHFLSHTGMSGMHYFSTHTLMRMLGFELFNNLELSNNIDRLQLFMLHERLLSWVLRFLQQSIAKTNGQGIDSLKSTFQFACQTYNISAPSSLNC